MNKFGNIYLSWRKDIGAKRHLVGVVKQNSLKGVTFQYLSESKIDAAVKDGFSSYTEFPDLSKIYKLGVLDVFKQRLFRSERSDYKDFLNFWGISEDKENDTLCLLAHTHGIVPTDNFEFLADFKLTKDLKIVSEIAGLSHYKISSEVLDIGDKVFWKRNITQHDAFQVDLFSKDGILLGCVKKVHSKIFYDKRSQNLNITIKALDKNGIIKRAFIEIENKK